MGLGRRVVFCWFSENMGGSGFFNVGYCVLFKVGFDIEIFVFGIEMWMWFGCWIYWVGVY